jgi:hypothetical protein
MKSLKNICVWLCGPVVHYNSSLVSILVVYHNDSVYIVGVDVRRSTL